MTIEDIRRSIEIQQAAGHDIIKIPASVLLQLIEDKK